MQWVDLIFTVDDLKKSDYAEILDKTMINKVIASNTVLNDM